MKRNLLSFSMMLTIFKESTAHMFILAFSAPFVCLIFLHYLFFPFFGVTHANDHITNHPWGLYNLHILMDWELMNILMQFFVIKTILYHKSWLLSFAWFSTHVAGLFTLFCVEYCQQVASKTNSYECLFKGYIVQTISFDHRSNH